MKNEITIDNNVYRMRKMNAIELLSLQVIGSFNTLEQSTKFYNTLLENMEIQVNDNWMPVKEKGKLIYYPEGIENNVQSMEKMLTFAIHYIESFFTKSNELKEKTK